MKAIVVVAGLAIVGGFGGAIYKEYDRIIGGENRSIARIEAIAKISNSQDLVKTTSAKSVKVCAAELQYAPYPPIATELLSELIVTQYELTKKFGPNTPEFLKHYKDSSNEISNRFYDDFKAEIEGLEPSHKERVIAFQKQLRTDRKTVYRCIHKKTYDSLVERGFLSQS